MSIPGVSTVTAGTTNLSVTGTNNLTIRNVPVLDPKTVTKSGNLVVKDIQVSSTGAIEIYKGTVVETETTPLYDQSLIEDNFYEIFLSGALSKIYDNTVSTYIELPYTRDTSAIFKYSLPDILDRTKPVNINMTYSGLLNEVATLPINVYHTVLSVGEFLSERALESTLKVKINSGLKIEKMLILQIPQSELREKNMVYLRVERLQDSSYLSGLAILNMSIQYYRR
jgi:hypothetical protein